MQSDNNRVHSRGFTLVEVVVVLVILAILAAIMIPSMSKWIDRAQERKLVTACRACVNAAATIAAENYAADTGTGALQPPTDAEIRALAGIDKGSVISVTIAPRNDRNVPPATVQSLSYTDGNKHFATYVLAAGDGYPSSHIIFSKPGDWELGKSYATGDLLWVAVDNTDFLFRCVNPHTSGSTIGTRNPADSNKTSWELIGTSDGQPPIYSSTIRYGAGFVVQYRGNVYSRKNYTLTGGALPTNTDYWLFIGPAA